MSLEKAQQEEPVKSGDTIALFVGSFDPPTMDHYRAVEALQTCPEIKQVWICPLSGASDNHVRGMASIMSVDMATSSTKVSLCTIALDKTMTEAKQAIDWVRAKFPYLKFKAATLNPDSVADSQPTIQVFLGVAGVVAEGASAVTAKFTVSPPDLKLRIKSGSDESRNFVAPVWNYIQKHKLYRD